jgi:hypothetical protein
MRSWNDSRQGNSEPLLPNPYNLARTLRSSLEMKAFEYKSDLRV